MGKDIFMSGEEALFLPDAESYDGAGECAGSRQMDLTQDVGRVRLTDLFAVLLVTAFRQLSVLLLLLGHVL